jgi:hypothetical protein
VQARGKHRGLSPFYRNALLSAVVLITHATIHCGKLKTNDIRIKSAWRLTAARCFLHRTLAILNPKRRVAAQSALEHGLRHMRPALLHKFVPATNLGCL